MNDYGGIPGIQSLDGARVLLYVAGWVAFGILVLWLPWRGKR
jgi:hypothetical protein